MDECPDEIYWSFFFFFLVFFSLRCFLVGSWVLPTDLSIYVVFVDRWCPDGMSTRR